MDGWHDIVKRLLAKHPTAIYPRSVAAYAKDIITSGLDTKSFLLYAARESAAFPAPLPTRVIGRLRSTERKLGSIESLWRSILADHCYVARQSITKTVSKQTIGSITLSFGRLLILPVNGSRIRWHGLKNYYNSMPRKG